MAIKSHVSSAVHRKSAASARPRTAQPKSASSMGRPPKSPGDRKGHAIRVLLTEDQKRILTAAAVKQGLDVSSWLRSVGIERAQELGVS